MFSVGAVITTTENTPHKREVLESGKDYYIVRDLENNTIRVLGRFFVETYYTLVQKKPMENV